MADMYFDVDAALSEVPVNLMPLLDDTDFKTRETAVAYNAAGMDLVWNFVTSAGAFTQTAVTPTTGGNYDWTHQGDGMYTIEIPASGGASINNDTEGYGWFTGVATGVLPWRGPVIGFRAAALNDALLDGGDLLDVSVTQWSGTAVATPDTAGYPKVTIKSGTGTGEVTLSSGEVTPTAASKTGYRLSATGVDDILDEALSGHVAAGSVGAALYTIRSGTAQAGASTTITLDASASAVDDFYNNQVIYIVSGTGVGQGRIIEDYNGTTKVATVSSWGTNPSSDSVFVIRPFGSIPGASAPTAAEVADAVWDEAMADHRAEGSFGTMLQGSHSGTAQAGAANSITLDSSGSSSTTDFYKYAVVEIVSGTGIGQSRQITAYNGTSKVATVDPAWTTAPDATSNYVIKGLGIDAATTSQIADAVWDEARAGHITAGTFGEYVLADAVRISGSTTAADGLENAVAGTTPMPSNVTQWNSAAIATPDTAGYPKVTIKDGTGTGEIALTSGAIDSVTTVTTVSGNVNGSVGSVTGAVGSVTGNVGGNVVGTIGGLDATARSHVNAEVVDALITDTYAEPSSVPAATSSIKDKINWIFAMSRNKLTQTASAQTLRNDADNASIGAASTSDDGTTFTRGEWS